MAWYRTALRKNQLRVDLGVYCTKMNALNDTNSISSAVRNILLTAIFQGLDVIGLVDANGPNIGWLGVNIATQNNLDLWVLPGEQYTCIEGEHLNIYKLKEKMPTGLTVNEAIKLAKSKGGFVVATNITKRQAQRYNKIKGTEEAPNAVEIYNASAGGYNDIQLDYPKFISSASQDAGDITNTNAYTIMPRENIEVMGLLPQNWGIDYIPNYLDVENQLGNQISQNPIVDTGHSPSPGEGAKNA